MTEIINLNKQRKAMLRTQKETQASENRRKFGQTKQEKSVKKAREEKLARHLNAHKRDVTED